LLYTDPFNSFHPSEREGESLRLIGCVLLVSGFFLVVAALVLLPGFGLRLAFTAAGLGVEVLGIGLLTQGYKPTQKEQR
jgi:low temperature requirement protein LtrA